MFYALDKPEILKTFFDELGNQDHKELLDYSRMLPLPFGFGKLTRLKNGLDAYYTYMCSLHNTFKKAIPTPVAGRYYKACQKPGTGSQCVFGESLSHSI